MDLERFRIELNKRGGYIGEINEKWDNGFYIKVELFNFNFEIGFFIDSGLMVFIILKVIFDMFMLEYFLEFLMMNIFDVSGKRFIVYGFFCLLIKLGSFVY